MPSFPSEFKPSLQYAGTIHKPIGEPYYFPIHHHPDEMELILVIEGEGTFQIDGKSHLIGPQMLVCFNQGLWHEEYSDIRKPFTTIYIGVSHLNLDGFPPGYFSDPDSPPVFFLKEYFFQIEQRFREIVKENAMSTSESQLICNHLLVVLLAELIRAVHRPHVINNRITSASQTVALVKRYIHENYVQEITLDDLADVAYISSFHLCRVFKKETGFSPIQYVIRYRIEAAKKLLTSANETLDNIAMLVGYQSETHFQNVFKKITGYSPGRFRTLQQGDKPVE